MTITRTTTVLCLLCVAIVALPPSADASSKTAVLIGIDQYLSHPPLPGCVEDCKALAETLRNRFGYSQVIEIYNERATRSGIIPSLRELISRLQVEDDLLIVFNGRGYLDPDKGESDWIAYDTQGETDTIPSELVQTLLRSAVLNHALTVSAAGFSTRSVNRIPPDSARSPSSPDSRKSRQIITYNSPEPFPALKTDEKGSLIRALSTILEAVGEGESITAKEIYTRILDLGKEIDQGLLWGTIRNTGDEEGEFLFGSPKLTLGSVSGVVVISESGLPAQGLKVVLQGSDQHGKTGNQGDFHLEAQPGVYSGLIFEGTTPEDVAFHPVEIKIEPSRDIALDRIEISFRARQDESLPPSPVPQPQLPPRDESAQTKEGEPSQALSNEAPATPVSSPEAPTIQFEVVLLDAFGKVSERQPRQITAFREDLGSGIFMDLVPIQGGVYWRGSDPNEEGYQPSEGPLTEVKVDPFYLGVCEVTQDQWQSVAALPPVERELDPDPSYFKGAVFPVEMVAWEECVEFCLRLSMLTGRHYRLPSESEWEYACRAGTESPFHFGPTLTSEVANYFAAQPYGAGPGGMSRNMTLGVGSLGTPNAFGLHDMHGNVAEWCADPWHPSYEGAPLDGSIWAEGGDRFLRVLRGGSWRNFAVDLRSAERKGLFSGTKNNILGFRVAMDMNPHN